MNSNDFKNIHQSSVTPSITNFSRHEYRRAHFGRRWLFLVMICLAFWQTDLQAQTWTNLGPKNEAGCMTRLSLHSASNRLFAASPDGGLWRSDISSSSPTWTPISDFLDNIEIRAFGVDPSNPDLIYAANKRGSLYSTTTGGTTWTKLQSFDKSFGHVNRILVNGLQVYLATTAGFFRSDNSGVTWVPLRASADVLEAVMDPDDSQHIYIGVRGEGVYKTLNRGTTWTPILIWTWSATPRINDNVTPPRGRPNAMIRIALGATKHNGVAETPVTRTVAVKFGHRIYISQSAGALGTFVDRDNLTHGGGGFYTRTESLVDDEWLNAIAIDPFDSDHIIVGQVDLFITSNGGVDWTRSTDITKHNDTQEVQFHRTIRGLVFIANDGGVERSTDGAARFRAIYSDLTTTQLERVGIRGDFAVGNSDHNGVIWTTALIGGQWTRRTPKCNYPNDAAERMGVYADRKRDKRFYLFHDTHIARLVFPNIPGDTCEKHVASFGQFPPYIVSPSPERPQGGIAVDTRDNSQLIIAAADVTTRKSCTGECIIPANTPFQLMLARNGDAEPTVVFDDTNQATLRNVPAWETVAQSIDDPFVSVAFSPQATGLAYAMTRSGALYTRVLSLPLPASVNFTRQNGWVTTQDGGGIRHIAVHPSDDDKIYAITENAFAKSSNRGVSWTRIPRNIPTDKYYAIAAVGQKLFLGASDGVYVSTNEGTSWTKINGNLPNVKVLQLIVDGNNLFAVTFGRGLWRIALSQLVP